VPIGTILLLRLSEGISLEQILGTAERGCTIKKAATSQVVALSKGKEEPRLMTGDPQAEVSQYGST